MGVRCPMRTSASVPSQDAGVGPTSNAFRGMLHHGAMDLPTPSSRRQVVGACALDCPDACSWVVSVEDDRAVALRGNPDHPFTRGGLCAKVNSYLDYAADPDRLLHPMRRVGPKGPRPDGGRAHFEPITWDEALGELAVRMRGAIDTHGGEAIWPYGGTGSISSLQGLGGAGWRLFHHLGASRHHANICSVAGHAGMAYSTGSAMGLDPEDLTQAGLIVLWGTNTLTTNLHQWPFVTQGRRAGAPLVVVDPVRTRTAAQADRHLAPRPGTDAALALSVMARLVELGATDEAYLAERTLGWPQFRDQVLTEWSLARGAEVCGLTPSEIEWFADAVASHSPLGIRALMGMQRHGGGAQAARTISCLPAVTGDYGRVGGGMCYSTSPAYGFDAAALTRPDLQPGPTRRLQMSSLGRELLERTDPPVTVLMVWAANPVAANPDQHRTRAALARDDLFTAVVEHRLTETCDYADLVLPGTTQLEHDDLVGSYGHLYLQWNTAAVAPPGQCRSHTEIFRGLARALDVTEPAVHASDDELARAALGTAGALAGITLESLRENGFERLSLPRPYLPFADAFPTPSGRFEFTSASAQAAGAALMPGYTPAHEALTARTRTGGLTLISAANHYLLNSTFSHSRIHARAGTPLVVVHPEDAAARGLEDGGPAQVANDRGSFEAVVGVSDAVRRGVAATTKATSTRATSAGATSTGATSTSGGIVSTVNATTADRDSDLGSGATFHDNLVWITAL